MSSLNIITLILSAMATAPVGMNQPKAPSTQATLLGQAMDQVKEDAEAKRKRAELECRQKSNQVAFTIDGITVNDNKNNKPTFDMSLYTKCIQEKQNKMKEIAKSVQSLIETKMNEKTPKQCVVPMNMKSKKCYLKSILGSLVETPEWSLTTNENVTQLWNKNELVQQVIIERPSYVATVSETPCKSYFSKPSFKLTLNTFGDVLNVNGAPKSLSKKLKCKPCSDYLKPEGSTTPSTLEGKFAECDESCDPMSSLLVSETKLVKQAK